jgi:hypothetical protein
MKSAKQTAIEPTGQPDSKPGNGQCRDMSKTRGLLPTSLVTGGGAGGQLPLKYLATLFLALGNFPDRSALTGLRPFVSVIEGGMPSFEAAAMKKLSDHQRAARRHNTDESGESLREAVKAGKKPETKLDKKVKNVAYRRSRPNAGSSF